jgi:PAT family beta-lactamase induction signal transducer AmpG
MISRHLWTVLTNRRVAVMLPLGFASGLPLALTSGTLQAWLTVAGVDLRTVGIFTLAGLPYAMKFLWAPLMDRFALPWLGRRRGWMVVTQFGVAAGLIAMGVTGPSDHPWALGVLALAVAFMSASLDIVFDAYRTDVLQPQERGFGAAVWVNGYRLALVVAGALALILADSIGWRDTYWLMAGLMTAGVATILLSPEPADPGAIPRSLAEAVWGPITEFFSRPEAVVFLLLIVLYKAGDAFAATLSTAFLIGGIGFTATDVGLMRGVGIAATLLGALAGGVAMARMGLFRALLAFGALQAVSNLSFVALAWVGKNYIATVAAVVFENFSGGMGTSAFVAFVMSLCDHRYTATQFALLSSLEALGRVLLGRPAAELVEFLGWAQFFVVTFLAALPGLLLLWRLREALDNHRSPESRRSAGLSPTSPAVE